MHPSSPGHLPNRLGALERYLAGACSPAEAEQLRAFLAQSPDAQGELDALLFALGPQGEEPQAREITASFERLQARRPDLQRGIDAVAGHANASHAKGHGLARVDSARPMQTKIGIALGAAIALGVFGTLFVRMNRIPATVERYQTALGQRSTVRLASGSTVMLAPASSVVMTETGVEVSGEAYFTVAPHPSRPFVVRTKNAVAQVLGTRFSVRQYPGEAISRVVVEDGKVMLRTAGPSNLQAAHPLQDSPVLSARMMALVTDSGATVTRGVATQDYTGWTQGRLVFTNVALGDVVPELIRAYGVTIHVSDSALAKMTMTMEVSVAEQPIGRVLELIGKATDAHYTQSGHTYVLSPGRDAAHTPPPVLQYHRLPQPEKQYGK